METPRNGPSVMFKSVVGIVLLVAGVIGLTRGWENYMYRQEYLRVPIKTLEARRDQVELMGVPLDGEAVDPESLGKFAFLDKLEFQRGGGSKESFVAESELILAEKGLIDDLMSFSRSPLEVRFPTSDAVVKQSRFLPAMRAAESLNHYANVQLDNGDWKAALDAVDVLVALQAAVSRIPTIPGITLWFGINLNVMSIVDRIRSEFDVSEEGRVRMLAAVSDDREMVRLRNHVARSVQEMAALSRGVLELDQKYRDQMRMMAEIDKLPELTAPGIEKALESNVLEVGLELMNASVEDSNPELVGSELDLLLIERTRNRSFEPSELMVHVFPTRFELVGRMIERVAQGRKVMQMVLSSQIQPGQSEATIGGVRVRTVVVESGDHIQITSSRWGSEETVDTKGPLVVSQQKGVGVLVRK